MKKLLLLVAAVSFTVGLNAQIVFQDNFSSGQPFIDGWQAVDANMDSDQWGFVDVTGYPNGIGALGLTAYSASSMIGQTGFSPDNLLISPAVDLSAVVNSLQLRFVLASPDATTASGNYQDFIDVYMVSDISLVGIMGATPIGNATVTAGVTLQNITLDVSAAPHSAGVYIVFRHHNCTDESSVILDNVVLEEMGSGVLTLSCPGAQTWTSNVDGLTMKNLTTMATGSTTCAGGVVNMTQSPAAGTTMTEGATNVTITATDNCGNTQSCVTVVNFSYAGIGELISENNIQLFPNPTNDVVNYTIVGDEVKSFTIHSMDGKKLIEKTVQNQEAIDLSGLNSGMYIVELHTFGGKIAKTTVVKK